MGIDISQRPLSASEIASKKDLLTSQTGSLIAKIRWISLLLMLITVSSMFSFVVGCATYHFLDWDMFLVVCTVTAVVLYGVTAVGYSVAESSIGSFGVSMIIAGYFAGVSSGVGAGPTAITGAGILGGCLAFMYLYLVNLFKRLQVLGRQLEELNDAPKTDYLQIVDWLADPHVSAFRDAVQGHGRMFTVGEVAAMKAHFDVRDASQQEIERGERVKQAFQRVFMENLTGEANA